MTTPNEIARGIDDDDQDMSSKHIRAEIEKTRERLEDTVEALGAQLNPSSLTQRLKDNVREATIGRVQHMANNTKERITETGRGLAETIRANPLPAAMVAAGLGWLLLSGRDQRSTHSYRDGIADMPDEIDHPGEPRGIRRVGGAVADKAQELTDQAKDAAEQVAERARAAGERVADRTREAGQRIARGTDRAVHRLQDGARATTQDLERRYEENPMGMGAVALALGLAVGLSVPATRKEVELMGDARDKLADRTRETLAETTEKVERVVERALPEVRNVVRDAAREVRDAARDEGMPA